MTQVESINIEMGDSEQCHSRKDMNQDDQMSLPEVTGPLKDGETVPKDPAEQRSKLDEIQLKISRRKLILETRADVEAFLETDDYGYYAVECTQDRKHGNLLHLMAGGAADKQLVEYLVKECPNFMHGMNFLDLRPLYIAITLKNNEFISAVLDSSDDESLAKLLDLGRDRENCIHAAVKSGLSSDLTIKLIQKASTSTLEAQDGGELTPLHWAVDYKKCTKGQFDIVRALLKKNDAGLDKISGKPDLLSVYRYHTETKRRHEQAKKPKPTYNQPFGGQEATPIDDNNDSSQDGKSEEPKKVAPKEQGQLKPGGHSLLFNRAGDDGLVGGKKGDVLKPGSGSPFASRRQSMAIDPKMPPPIRRPSILEDKQNTDRRQTTEKTGAPKVTSQNGASRTTPRKRFLPQRSGLPRPMPTTEISVDEETAEKIAKELKLHYLRSIFKQYSQKDNHPRERKRNHDKAVEFLYGDNKENMHICFSFLQGPSKMSAEKFRTTYGGFNFDPVLQYVAFRRVQFTMPQLPPRKNAATNSLKVAGGKGRKDMEIPFEWLYNTKGVRNIMKVIVDDLESPSHSDESIEAALKLFEIEILDWRKIDLCPETICNSCKKLREIHLWWSGNNGMLRAWSEPDGLAKLKRLEAIHLHQTQNLESEFWIEKKIAQFRGRLRNIREAQNKDRRGENRLPDIYVPYPVKANSISEMNPREPGVKTDPKVQLETHKWLRIMDTFADGIEKFDPKDDEGFFTSLPDKLKKDVRVALIDDGVQFGHESLQGKITDGWSFDDGYDGADLPGARKPFHESQTGHGTLMANMICRVCPGAKIFVYRLKVIPGNGSKSHFTPESAAEAVEYCATRGFDVISISWTVTEAVEKIHTASHADQTNKNSPTMRIQAALNRAYENGALIFCAGPDEGSMTDGAFNKYYPVGCMGLSSRIFKIGAATATNVRYDRTGKESQLDFILPGHEVTERDDAIEVEKNSPKTGSSVATALAAGLAALIIHCVRLAAIETYREEAALRKAGETDADAKKKTSDANAVTEGSLDVVKSFDGMMQIFHGIPKSTGEKDKFLEVNSTFDDPGKCLCNKEMSLKTKRDKIAYLARDFVGWAKHR
ncbi:hypothetical protein F4677DRAFT_192150 [Hypoxylon crocopeplum]|nr:hypothetical protein F4677DRAFT_192150 [Hypoxylon crocopeplum]